MEFSPDGPLAIPLWINGHAFLTVTESFYNVTHPTTGESLRRVPLCGASEATAAVTAALHAVFLTMGAFTLLSSLSFWSLRPRDGESVSRGATVDLP